MAPKLKANNAVGFRSARGEKDNGCLRQLRVVADAFADIEPVRIRQHDIEQNEIWTHTPAEIERAAAGLRTRKRKALFFQIVFQQGVQIAVVFNEKYSFLPQVRPFL